MPTIDDIHRPSMRVMIERRARFPKRYRPDTLHLPEDPFRSQRDAIVKTASKTARRRTDPGCQWQTFLYCCGFDIPMEAPLSILGGLCQEPYLDELKALQDEFAARGVSLHIGEPHPTADCTIVTSLVMAYQSIDGLDAIADIGAQNLSLAETPIGNLPKEQRWQHPTELFQRFDHFAYRIIHYVEEFDADESYHANALVNRLHEILVEEPAGTTKRAAQHAYQKWQRGNDIKEWASLDLMTRIIADLNQAPQTSTERPNVL